MMNTQNKQKGFTMVEILIVLVILAILSAVAYSFATSGKSSGDNYKLQRQIVEGTQSAIAKCLSESPTSLATCTDSRITATDFSVFENTTTACGDTWSVTATTDNLTWVYPLDSCSDPDNKGAAYSTTLSAMSKVSATYDSTTDDLTIVFDR